MFGVTFQLQGFQGQWPDQWFPYWLSYDAGPDGQQVGNPVLTGYGPCYPWSTWEEADRQRRWIPASAIDIKVIQQPPSDEPPPPVM